MRLRNVMLGAVGVLTAFSVSAFEREPLGNFSGEEIFMKYCAACHGSTGRGNGPVAHSLKIAVPDLTAISRHYGGFPAMLVREVIDGRAEGRLVSVGMPDDWANWTPFTYPFNLTGQPAASIPCGFTKAGLPVGLQIIGPRFADALVLRAARAFETVRAIKPPDLSR